MKALKQTKKDSFEYGSILLVITLLTVLVVGFIAK